jgi:uncharacterized protein
MRNSGFWIFSVFLLLLDIYIYQVVKFLSIGLSPKVKIAVLVGFWVVSICSIIITFLFPILYFNPKFKVFITYAFSIVFGLFFFKLIIILFFLIDDIRRGITWIIQKFSNAKKVDPVDGISRSAFISWLGIAVGGTLFGSLLIGFTNKYNYGEKRIKLKFANLPTAFKGLKIVQISDIHSGSFDDVQAVAKGVKKILAIEPDVILFTGDLVNNVATEMTDYKDVFAGLKAPLGVYSILGNHDYGDYYQWKDRDDNHLAVEQLEKQKYIDQLQKLEADSINTLSDKQLALLKETHKDLIDHYKLHSPMQQKNLDDLKELQKEMGWKMLMNENVILERGEDKIAILGIENWGARGKFPRYGKMIDAHQGTENVPFKILMSHDPSHWDAQVTKDYKDVDLTLSGHTHGMQFGVEIPGFRWSPIQYIYKQWAGIYEKENQKLYVNRGFGFLGYPGRVGIMPEITVIELV